MSERLVVLHGLGGSAALLRERLPIPGALIPDVRGHGAGPRLAPGEGLSLATAVDDLARELDGAGWDTAVLLGGSMGAAIATAFALAHPDRVERLGIITPAIGWEDPAILGPYGRSAEVMRTSWDDGLAHLHRELTDLDVTTEQADVAVASFAANEQTSMVEAICSVVRWRIVVDPAELRALTMPVLITWVLGDPIHPASLAREMAQHLPHATVQEFADPATALEALGPVLLQWLAGP